MWSLFYSFFLQESCSLSVIGVKAAADMDYTHTQIHYWRSQRGSQRANWQRYTTKGSRTKKKQQLKNREIAKGNDGITSVTFESHGWVLMCVRTCRSSESRADTWYHRRPGASYPQPTTGYQIPPVLPPTEALTGGTRVLGSHSSIRRWNFISSSK